MVLTKLRVNLGLTIATMVEYHHDSAAFPTPPHAPRTTIQSVSFGTKKGLRRAATLTARRPVGTGSSQSQHPEHARHTMNSTAFVIASAADKIMPKVAGPRAV